MASSASVIGRMLRVRSWVVRACLARTAMDFVVWHTRILMK